jgi:hypothetical protein
LKKKKQKKHNEIKLRLQKITNFTTQSFNTVYKNFKKKQKIAEKNELKFREEQVKKEQKKIELKIKEQLKRDDEIKIKEQDVRLIERELESKDKEQSVKDDEIKTEEEKLKFREQKIEISEQDSILR